MKGAFVGKKNFDDIKMHGTTIGQKHVGANIRYFNVNFNIFYV